MFGVHKVGFYVMFYGIFLTIGCTLNAVLVKYIGRIGSIVIGMILYFPTLFLMLFWQNPNPELYSMLFVLASKTLLFYLTLITFNTFFFLLNRFHGCGRFFLGTQRQW